jgi:hypothetical protein
VVENERRTGGDGTEMATPASLLPVSERETEVDARVSRKWGEREKVHAKRESLG